MTERTNPFKYIYQKSNTEKDFDFPVCLDIELTNNCNLKCLMCPVGIGKPKKRKNGYMTQQTFNKILDNIKGYQVGLRFIRWGEPTLHPNFIEFIKQTKENGHLCHLNTNGMLLNESIIKNILDSGLDSIKFSFQGIDEKSYKEMRQGADWNKLINNVKTMYNQRIEKEKIGGGYTCI